jgi:hypothetical protein
LPWPTEYLPLMRKRLCVPFSSSRFPVTVYRPPCILSKTAIARFGGCGLSFRRDDGLRRDS